MSLNTSLADFSRISLFHEKQGQIIPGALTLIGQCVRSEQLMENSCLVNNGRTCDLKIKDQFNKYQVCGTALNLHMSAAALTSAAALMYAVGNEGRLLFNYCISKNKYETNKCKKACVEINAMNKNFDVATSAISCTPYEK